MSDDVVDDVAEEDSHGDARERSAITTTTTTTKKATTTAFLALFTARTARVCLSSKRYLGSTQRRIVPVAETPEDRHRGAEECMTGARDEEDKDER
ncbi:hypothetical protein PUN28_016433 [Cardiocondyla obscurior]|uniref:Uncharacterized protein n=1 Tax=Cardiocondyla obscurior TaxID=286306 RepID=A0AAW2ESX9_9HYME